MLPLLTQAQATSMAPPPPCASFHVFMLDDLFPAPSGGAPTMHSRLWSQLPNEVLELILLRLPASSQARFQAVCKAWQRLLLSQDFKKLSAATAFSSGRYVAGFTRSHLELGQADDRLLEVSDRYVLQLQAQGAYKVHRLSLDYLPGRIWSQTPEPPRLIFQQGLLLAETVRRNEGRCAVTVDLCVVNPVNRTWRELPVLLVDPEHRATTVAVEVAVDAAGSGFEVRVWWNVKDGAVKTNRAVTWVYSSGSHSHGWSRLQDVTDSSRNADRMDHEHYPLSSAYVLNMLYLLFFHRMPPAYDDEHTVRGERVAVPEVWELPDRCVVWRKQDCGREVLSSMPEELLAKVRRPWSSRPEVDQEYYGDFHPEEGMAMDMRCWYQYRRRLYVDSSQLVGDVIFITLFVGAFHKQVVAFHVVNREWQIVLCDRGRRIPSLENASGRDFDSWQKELLDKWTGMGMSFLQPRPSLDCSLLWIADY